MIKNILFFGTGVAVSFGYLYLKNNPNAFSTLKSLANTASSDVSGITNGGGTQAAVQQQPIITAPPATDPILTMPVNSKNINAFYGNQYSTQIGGVFYADGGGDNVGVYPDPTILKRPVFNQTANSLYKVPAFMYDFSPIAN